MRFMMMHKNDPNTEAGLMPGPKLMQEMGAFIGTHAQAGRFLDGAGLRGSKERTRLTFREGKSTVKHGPYAGETELPASVLLIRVDNCEQAIGWAERYGKILGNGEIELGAVTEPWDLGMAPKPENPPLQLLFIEKASEAMEKEGGRTSSQKAELTRLRTEMSKAGVLVKTFDLQPSSKAKRLTFKNHQLTTVDGPFAESKELLGGFSIMELSGFEEAVALCKPYAEILGGTLEIDLRLLDTSVES